MLVINRRVNESVVLSIPIEGGAPIEIEVMVIQAQPGRLRLGIVAPENVRVMRKEIANPREKS